MKLLTPNTMIQSRYLVVHLIGKGGMGEVYLAVDQRLGSAIALKRTSFADDANLAAAFEREAKILARLRHPVLPKVSDHFTDNGDQFLVMEHISGDDLSSRLESGDKAFPLSWVMFWADQLLDALSYLHSHEPPIIHRDIKPQNLKLTDDNHIVLLDFGLSKDTSNQSIVSQSGTSGSVVGYTPHFAPMEQIRGTGTNARSDIYALSATLYQLMTNLVPPDALSRADRMLSSHEDPIRALSEVNPAISPAVSDVILKGLEVSQEKRFATATEMQKALRAAYAQAQTAMSADTAVFNIGNQAGDDLHNTTPPLDTARAVAPSEMQTMVPPAQFVTLGHDLTVDPPSASEHIEVQPTIAMGERNTDAAVQQPAIVMSEMPSEDIPAAASSDGPEIETKVRAHSAAVGAAVKPVSPPTARPVSAVPPKKKSKAGLVVGGLIGLLLLAGIAGGAGWFAYTRYYLPSRSKASASPSPSTTVLPSPEPSAPVLAETNQNGNSNTTPGQVSGTNSSESNSNQTAVTTTRSTPSAAPKNTPAQSARPTLPKATPQPKAHDPRKDILP